MAVRYYARPQVLFRVSRGSFMPSPRVDSAVLRLDLHSAPPVELKDEAAFFTMVRAAFGQRRKTVLNAVASGLSLPKERVAAAMKAAGVVPSARAEQLTMEELAALSGCLLTEG